MHDQMNSLNVLPAITPKAALTNLNTPFVSAIIDTLGYNSLFFAIMTGVNTDTNATFTPLLEDGDIANLSDAATVSAAETLGTVALATFDAPTGDSRCFKIGYAGHHRYVRLTITPAGNDAGDAFVTAIAIQGQSRMEPTPNPPA